MLKHVIQICNVIQVAIGVSVHKFTLDMGRNTHNTQRSFFPGGRLFHKAIDLDSGGRILALQAINFNQALKSKRLAVACLAFFDFAAAFPAMIQGDSLSPCSQGITTGLTNLFKAFYSSNGAYSTVTGELDLVFGTYLASRKASSNHLAQT